MHVPQSCSALSHTDQESYDLIDPDLFQTYGYEYTPSKGTDTDGYIYWMQNGTVTWSLKESGLAGNESIDLSQRLVPREVRALCLSVAVL